jgi:membrane protein YdbS with pleckstrin-like domain
MEFINEQINTADLPRLETLKTEHLSANYLNVLYITRGLLGFCLIAATFVAVFLLNDMPIWLRSISAAILTLIIIWFVLLSKKVFNARSYALRQHDILYTRGFIFRSTTVVPFNRIQHVEIVSGPIDRLYHLSTLKIFTAGGSQSDITIPGLLSHDAQSIKSFIISKTSYDEEE